MSDPVPLTVHIFKYNCGHMTRIAPKECPICAEIAQARAEAIEKERERLRDIVEEMPKERGKPVKGRGKAHWSMIRWASVMNLLGADNES